MKKRIGLLSVPIIISCFFILWGNMNNGLKFKDFSKSISSDKIYNHIEVITNEYNSRITGFDGENGAGEYIKNEFLNMGLEISEMKFPADTFKNKSIELEINEPIKKKIISKTVINSGSTVKEGINCEIVSGFRGIKEDMDNLYMNGKVILMEVGGDSNDLKVERAEKGGAAGVIFYDQNLEKLTTGSLKRVSKIPVMTVGRIDGEYINELLNKEKKVKINIKVDCESKTSESRNIVGEIKAKDRNRPIKTLIIGAHYDSIDTLGVNDNASGVAVLMETAKILSAQKLNCDIKFIAFGAGESESKGASYYLSNLSDADKKNVLAVINLDMVGVGNTVFINTVSSKTPSFIVDLLEEGSKKYGLSYEKNEKAGGDHEIFFQNGIASVMLSYGPDSYNHTALDLIDKINKENLINISKLVSSISYEIAHNPEKYYKVK